MGVFNITELSHGSGGFHELTGRIVDLHSRSPRDFLDALVALRLLLGQMTTMQWARRRALP